MAGGLCQESPRLFFGFPGLARRITVEPSGCRVKSGKIAHVSYGRFPHYIYECACEGSSDDFHGPTRGERHVVFLSTAISWDELAQFVAAADRAGELAALVDRGREVYNADPHNADHPMRPR